jgi:hypothetical protein
MTQMIHIDHPDDERFDDIHIRCVERWKESELSGDEWRFSYVAEIKRKGELIVTVSASKLDWLLQGLQWRILTMGEDDKFDRDAWNRTKSKCDQPGCDKDPIIFCIRRRRYSERGEELAPNDFYDGKEYRQFCAKHKIRGDCGLDDSDANYIVMNTHPQSKEQNG